MARIVWKDAYGCINPLIDAVGMHVWPFDPSFPVDVQFWFYGRPHTIRMNRHDYFELIYLDRGRVLFQVQDRTLVLNEGDLFIVGSTLFHRLVYDNVPSKAPRLMFLPQLVSPFGMSHEDEDYLMPFLVQDARFPHIVPAASGLPKQIRLLMAKIHQQLPPHTTGERLCAKAYLKTILGLLVKHYAGHEGSEAVFAGRRRDLDRLRPVFDFIDRHYSDAIGVEDVASLVSMSRRTFTRFFKKVTGQTFVGFVNSLRIERARYLLASPDRTIAQVSQEVGFCNQSYFGVVFRRLGHVSAREYRKQLA